MQPLDTVFTDPLVEAKGLVPRFYMRERVVKFVTKRDDKTGDAVAAEERVVSEPYVEIHIMGDKLTVPVEKVTERHQRMFPDYWRAFLMGTTGAIGTPLAGHFDEATIHRLGGFHIHTLESLAETGGQGVDAIGMGAREMVAQAKRILHGSHEAALKAENDALKNQVGYLGEQMETLMARLDRLAPPAAPVTALEGEQPKTRAPYGSKKAAAEAAA